MYTKIYKVIKLYILIKTFDGLILIMIKKINKLVFYIFVLRKYKIPKERIEQIVNDEISCLTDEETMTKRFVNSLKYLFNNINQVFNEEILNHLYFLLTNMLLDKEISSKIIQLYYGNIDNSTYYLTAIIHLYITNNIKISAIEYAFIVSELIMLKKNKSLIIPFEFSHHKYNKAIQNNDISLLVKIFLEIEYNLKECISCKYTRDEIIKKIKQTKVNLKLNFNISKLYLFGSFAKGTNNEDSDIDFLVILDDSLINIERLEQISLIKEYLSELFECSVDVLDFTFALRELGENEMEHIITLI